MAKEHDFDREWKQEFCDCCNNCGLCCRACFCPCLVFGEVAEALGEDRCLHACLYCCTPFNVYVAAKVRQNLRFYRQIHGSFGSDCCLSCCCMFCALVQEAYEVDYVRKQFDKKGVSGPITTQPGVTAQPAKSALLAPKPYDLNSGSALVNTLQIPRRRPAKPKARGHENTVAFEDEEGITFPHSTESPEKNHVTEPNGKPAQNEANNGKPAQSEAHKSAYAKPRKKYRKTGFRRMVKSAPALHNIEEDDDDFSPPLPPRDETNGDGIPETEKDIHVRPRGSSPRRMPNGDLALNNPHYATLDEFQNNRYPPNHLAQYRPKSVPNLLMPAPSPPMTQSTPSLLLPRSGSPTPQAGTMQPIFTEDY